MVCTIGMAQSVHTCDWDFRKEEHRELARNAGYQCSIGPMGAVGFVEDFWFHSKARQILVLDIESGSPAEGVLRLRI